MEEEIAVEVSGRRDDEEEISSRKALTHGIKFYATGGWLLTTNMFKPYNAPSGSILQ